jgi:hypothetical protein
VIGRFAAFLFVAWLAAPADLQPATIYQPDEHALELGRAHLLELHDALTEMGGTIVRRVLRDFTVWPLRPPAK